MPADSTAVLCDTLKYHQKCFQTLSTKSVHMNKNMLQKVLTKKKKDLNPHPRGHEEHALNKST